MPSFLEFLEKKGQFPPCLAMSFAAYIAFFSNDIQALTEEGLVCRRPKGNDYICCDDRWILEFYHQHRSDTITDLVHAVMSNIQMWGQDLTQVPGFEAATIENLTKIRNEGAEDAFACCLQKGGQYA